MNNLAASSEVSIPKNLIWFRRKRRGIQPLEINEITILIINDGSTDRTVQVAQDLGVTQIISHNTNKGLATAFRSGLAASLKMGADIIVNTDADNQYPGAAIPALIQPILQQKADIVIGDRQTSQITHFSFTKKFLQKVGSAIVRYVAGIHVPDAPSGFRALSKQAALRLNIFTRYTYTLEMIIQAGKKNLQVVWVPVRINPKTRKSRLVKSNFNYVVRSAGTILRLFLLYEPLRTFLYLGIPFFFTGLALWLRFLVLMLIGESARGSNIQSIIVGAVLIITSVLLFAIGLIGEVMTINRLIQEETLYHLKEMNLGGKSQN